MSTESAPTTEPEAESETGAEAAAEAASPEVASPVAADEVPDSVAPATFDELQDSGGSSSAEEVDLAVILDVPVTLALEVGRAKMKIRDLLRLNQGSVVELDRSADQPMDLLVNGTLVATAEIVVVEESFGIRLIDVVSPSERIKNLRGGASS